MAVSQLSVYNEALRLLGLRKLSGLTEDRKPRYVLDDAYGYDLVKACLELSRPQFAITTRIMTGGTPVDFPYQYRHELPDDYVCTIEAYADVDLDDEIERYVQQSELLYLDFDTFYLRYVQDGPTTSFTNWTPSFSNFVAAHLAAQVAMDLAPRRVEYINGRVADTLKALVEVNKLQIPDNRPITPTVTLTNAWRAIYNDALSIIGMEPLATNDNQTDRKVKLDRVLDARLVESLLEDISWQYAITSDKVEYNSSIEPEWGYKYAFDKPSNLLRLEGIYTDEYFTNPLVHYHDEDSLILCDLQTIYVQYVSDSFITNPSAWPAFFSRLVAARMAKDAAGSISGADVRRADEEYTRRMYNATTNDSVQSPPRVIREGNWVKARGRGVNSRRRPEDW